MSAPAPRESEKSPPRPSPQPGQNSGGAVSSAGRTRLQDEVRRTEGFEEQSKLVEADRGPEPSPEVAAEIAAERQARGQCAPNTDIALLAELLGTETRVRPLIDAITGTSRTTIAACAAAMRESAAEVVGWASAENRALIELFSEYAASLEGGEISGDALGIASVANMLNPLPQLKTVMSIILAGAGFAARDYNRKLSEWRKSLVGKELTKVAGRTEGTSKVQLDTWNELFGRLADGSLEVSELSFQAGHLDGLLAALSYGADELRQKCKRREAPEPSASAILKQTIAKVRETEAQTREHLGVLLTLPSRMAAENKAALARMKVRYIAWLAQQGAIKVRGRLFADRQSGADVLHVTLEQVVAVEGLEASGFGAETAQTICEKPGLVLAAGGTLALSLDSVVHGHEREIGSHESGAASPTTFRGELGLRIGPKGVTRTASGAGISYEKLEELLRARR